LTYNQNGKKITVVMDTLINEKIKSLAKDSDILISEATFMENSENGKKLAQEHKHMTIKQTAEVAKKTKSKKLFLVHISQRNENKSKEVLEEAKKVFKNTEIARDLDKVSI
jgi:ribonuclease Z